MSVSIENFLKTIYHLEFELNKKTGTANIAGELNITYAAVTDMSKKLHAENLIHYEKYKNIRLTPEGQSRALNIIRKHRIWETFLFQVLNVPIERVHDEAERLEHQTSDYMVDKLEQYLQYPKFDPHGEPIPDRNGQMLPNLHLSLTHAELEKWYTLQRINYNKGDLADFYAQNGFRVGKNIRVLQKFAQDNSLLVETEQNRLTVALNIAQYIYISAT